MPIKTIQAGAQTRMPVEFSERDIDAFSALSGDRNPIHLDADYARRRGFEGRVVHGALVVAAVSRLLAQEIPGPGCVWHSLSLKFKAPLYAAQRAELAAEVTYWSSEHRVVRLALELLRDGKCLARGTAQASLAREG